MYPRQRLKPRTAAPAYEHPMALIRGGGPPIAYRGSIYSFEGGNMLSSSDVTGPLVVPTSEKQSGVGSTAPGSGYFVLGTRLNDRQQAYCRCLLHVREKQPDECIGKPSYAKTNTGKSCYSPYAVCTASVRVQAQCATEYNYAAFTDSELRAFAHNHSRIPVPNPFDRQQMLANIQDYLNQNEKF